MAPAAWADIISRRLSLLGVSQPTLCALVPGLNLNRIGLFLANMKDLDNPTVVKIYDVLVQLERIQNLMSPVPVDFRNVRAIKELLERVRLDGFEAIMPVFKPASENASELH